MAPCWCFPQVGKGVHVLHRPGLRIDVLAPPVWVGELGVGVRQEYSNRFRVAMHHRFLTRAVLDPKHSDLIILKLHRVMPGVNFHGVFGDLLSRCLRLPSFPP